MGQAVQRIRSDFFAELPVVVEAQAAPMSSGAGMIVIRQFDDQIGFTERFIACLNDPRDPRLVDHLTGRMARLVKAECNPLGTHLRFVVARFARRFKVPNSNRSTTEDTENAETKRQDVKTTKPQGHSLCSLRPPWFTCLRSSHFRGRLLSFDAPDRGFESAHPHSRPVAAPELVQPRLPDDRQTPPQP